MDRRPRQPRQLAGEYGSSEHGEARFDAAELSGEWLFDADADAVRCCKSLDDPVNADRPADDVGFKPKCLGIASSIQIHVAHAVRSSPSPIRTRRCDSIKALRSIAHKYKENRIIPVVGSAFTSSIALTDTQCKDLSALRNVLHEALARALRILATTTCDFVPAGYCAGAFTFWNFQK